MAQAAEWSLRVGQETLDAVVFHTTPRQSPAALDDVDCSVFGHVTNGGRESGDTTITVDGVRQNSGILRVAAWIVPCRYRTLVEAWFPARNVSHISTPHSHGLGERYGDFEEFFFPVDSNHAADRVASLQGTDT